MYSNFSQNFSRNPELVDAAGCKSFCTFAKCKDALWSIGVKAVVSYDGKDWNQIA